MSEIGQSKKSTYFISPNKKLPKLHRGELQQYSDTNFH